jgi:peptidoglycan/xylan/chitin deacetylase (PgdA/CDA1 family)
LSILCYHSIEPDWDGPLAIAPGAFADHCAWMAAARDVVPLDRAVERLDGQGRLPRGLTALTFDDGFVSLYEHALTILERYRLPATVFLVAETLTPQGRAVDWVDTPPRHTLRTLDTAQVLEMRDRGVRFASHSWAHHDLTKLSEEECRRDLRESRELLEEVLGEPVRYLAYPRGRHREHVRRATAAAGYTHGFALPESREAVGPMAVPRAGVFPPNGRVALRIKSQRRYVQVRTSRVFPAARSLAAVFRRAT